MHLARIIKKQYRKYFKRKTPKFYSCLDKNRQDVLNGIIAYNKYGAYLVPQSSSHRPACQAVLHGEVYELETIEFIQNYYSEGDIIHAGTFFGDFLPALSAIVKTEGTIWAFEPNIESFRCAQHTIMLNNLTNVQIKNNGLGDSHSHKYLLIQDKTGFPLGGGSSISTSKTKHTQSVEIDSIDNLIAPQNKICIIHLDVEGFEKEVLEGALKTIQKNLPLLILEDNNNVINTHWFSTNISILGYRKIDTINKNTILSIDN